MGRNKWWFKRYIKGTITITGHGDDDAARILDERNKGVIFKHCAPFTKCISRINGTEKHVEVYGSTTKMILMIT